MSGPEQPESPWVPPASAGVPPASAPEPEQQSQKTSGFAIASLVLGIIGLPLICPLLIPSALALIFGFIARRDIKAKGQSGGGMALAGLITGAIGTVCSIIVIIVAIVYLADADWDDPDDDGAPNFVDEHDNNPKLQVIRPIAMVTARAFQVIAL